MTPKSFYFIGLAIFVFSALALETKADEHTKLCITGLFLMVIGCWKKP